MYSIVRVFFIFLPGRFRNIIVHTFVLSFSLYFPLFLSLSLSLSIYIYISILGIQKYQCTSDFFLKVQEIIFFVWGKTYNWAFLGIFQGGRDLFDTEISLRYAQTIKGSKRSWPPQKIPLKCPIICFAPEKKNYPGLSKSAVH